MHSGSSGEIAKADHLFEGSTNVGIVLKLFKGALQTKMIFFIESIFHPEFHKTKEKILKHGFIRQKNAQSVDFRVSTRYSLHPQIVSDRILFDFIRISTLSATGFGCVSP